MMDGDIRVNTYDDGTTDAVTGEQKIRNFNINRSEERRVGKECFRRCRDRKSTRLNSSHFRRSRMPSSA